MKLTELADHIKPRFGAPKDVVKEIRGILERLESYSTINSTFSAENHHPKTDSEEVAVWRAILYIQYGIPITEGENK